MLKKIIVLCTLLFVASTSASAFSIKDITKNLNKIMPFASLTPSPSPTSAPVLGNAAANSSAPHVYINGGTYSYSSGGLMTQAVTDEAGLYISGYKIPSELQVKIFRANLDQLYAYLAHDKEYKQLNPKLDTSSLTPESTLTFHLENNGNDYSQNYETLPLSGAGLWYIDITGSEVQTSVFLLRSKHGVYTVEEKDTLLFWGQNYDNLRSVGEGGSLKTYNFQDGTHELSATSFDSRGIASLPLTSQADVAISQINDDIALIPLNLSYLNTGYNYSEFKPQTVKTRYFTFTDRPLYLPGDTVNFKAVLRDDVDAKYTIPGGSAIVKISYSDQSTEVAKEMTLPISADGTINGSYKLDPEAKTGFYSLSVQTPRDKERSEQKIYDYEYTGVYDYAYASFNVEYYRKPEATIDISSNVDEAIAKDTVTIDLSGSYYSGSPLMGQEITYKINSSDYYEYSYLQDYEQYKSTLNDDYRYGNWYGSHEISSGTVTLDKNGRASITVPTSLDFNVDGVSQVFMVEATLADGSQDPLYTRKNILVRAGQFGIFATEYNWGAKLNSEFSLPYVLAPYNSNTKVGKTKVVANLVRKTWEKTTDPNEKYPQYTEKTDDLGATELYTDDSGRGTYRFTPTQTGSYTLEFSSTDKIGNTVKKKLYFYVSDYNYPSYVPGVSEEKLSLLSNQKKYTPGDTATFTVSSTVADRDVLLSFSRGYQHRYELVKLNGKTATVDEKIVESDQPNLYVSAASFDTYRLDQASLSLQVNTSDKKMVVGVTPDKTTYGPGENVTLNISTTDATGKPVSAEVAVWSVDKAIFALTDNRLPDIFKTFWTDRANSTSTSHSLRGILVQTAERGGGCFAAGTQVTLAGGTTKAIEEIKVGDQIQTFNQYGNLVVAPVTAVSEKMDEGYLLVNNTLRLTPDHLLNVNGTWRQASQLNIGDYLTTLDGQVAVTALSYHALALPVYNLTVDREHTFLADGIWVHNEKGLDRTVFKDMAYWNPTVRTNGDGRASVTFKLPDNLTTWTIAAVGSNTDTVVGQTSTDIQVNKDLVVKPIVPNLVRVGDKLTLSAIARNFTDNKDSYKLSLKLEGAMLDDPAESSVTMDGKSTEQIYWRVNPSSDASVLKYVMGMTSTQNEKARDTVSGTIPVEPYGFHAHDSSFKIGNTAHSLSVPKDVDPTHSKVTLDLSPSLVTSLQSSMRYLLGYPYGCVEQLTSKLVPALLAKSDAKLFASALDGVDNLDQNIKDAISKINDAHESWSGWAWWSHGNVTPFVTSYVLEAYRDAEKLGFSEEVKGGISSGRAYLKGQYDREKPMSNADRITRRYGLSLFKDNSHDISAPEGDLSNLSPDLLAMHILTSLSYQETDRANEAIETLVTLAKTEGDSVYWDAGSSDRLGSIGASTAWAVRALIAANHPSDLAVKAVRYLVKHRTNDYWYNSYATVLTSRAILDMYHQGGEADPNYAYTVKLGKEVVGSGKVTSATSPIKSISIPIEQLVGKEQELTIEVEGEGQLYSTLVTDLFRTDRNLSAESNGLSIARRYVNDRKPDYNIALGDVVRVEFEVNGLSTSNNYLVIEDQLPAGLIPVNETFKNEQYENASSSREYGTMKEYTKNGANLVINQVNSGKNIYSYKARVVSLGEFQAPPAVASLMYSPEINARTVGNVLSIATESKILPDKIAGTLLKKVSRWQYVAAILFILAGIGLFIYKKRHSKVQLPPDGVEKNTTPESEITPPDDAKS